MNLRAPLLSPKIAALRIAGIQVCNNIAWTDLIYVSDVSFDAINLKLQAGTSTVSLPLSIARLHKGCELVCWVPYFAKDCHDLGDVF